MTLVRRIGSARKTAMRTQINATARSTRQNPIIQSHFRERRRRGGSNTGPPGVCDGAAEGAAKLHLYRPRPQKEIGSFLHCAHRALFTPDNDWDCRGRETIL